MSEIPELWIFCRGSITFDWTMQLTIAHENIVEAAEGARASVLLTDSSLAEHENNTRQPAAAKCFPFQAA